MICPHCNAWIPDDSRRCPECQELLRKRTVVEEQPEEEAKPEKKNRTNTVDKASKSDQSSADRGTAGRQNTPAYADDNSQKHKSYEELDAEISQVLEELKSDKSFPKTDDYSDSAPKKQLAAEAPSSLWQKCTKLFFIFMLIGNGIWLFNIIRFSYGFTFWTLFSFVVPIIAYIAMRKCNVKLMFTYLGIQIAFHLYCTIKYCSYYNSLSSFFTNYDYDIYYLNFSVLATILFICVLKCSDKPWMKYKKAYSLVLIIPMALYYLHYTDLGYTFASFDGLLYTITNIADLLCVCAQAYWIAAYPVGFAQPKYNKRSDIRSGSGSVSPYIRAIRSSVSSSGKSILFIIAAVLMTLNCLSMLDSGIELVNFSGTLSSIENLLDIDGLSQMGYYIDSAVNEILGGISNIITTVKIIYHLPTILILLGLWMICFGSFSTSPNLNAVANGCKIIKTVKIILCIFKSLLWFVLICFAIGELGEYSEDIAVVIAIFIGIILTVELVNCWAICRALNAAADAATGSVAMSGTIPGVLTFFCFCDGIFGILVSGFTFAALMVPVSVLLFGIVLIGFKNKLSAASYVK